MMKESLLFMMESKVVTHGMIGGTNIIEMTNHIEMNVWIVLILVVIGTVSSIVIVVMVLVLMNSFLLTSISQRAT
jgi:hypothetical protein